MNFTLYFRGLLGLKIKLIKKKCQNSLFVQRGSYVHVFIIIAMELFKVAKGSPSLYQWGTFALIISTPETKMRVVVQILSLWNTTLYQKNQTVCYFSGCYFISSWKADKSSVNQCRHALASDWDGDWKCRKEISRIILSRVQHYYSVMQMGNIRRLDGLVLINLLEHYTGHPRFLLRITYR